MMNKSVSTLHHWTFRVAIPTLFISLVLSLRRQSVALLTPSSFTMSSLDKNNAPFSYSSSTFIHAQFALLDLPVTPQQKSFKSAHSILRKPISPTLHTSHSDFLKQMLIPPPMTFLSLSTTSNSLIFTWKTLSRPSGNPKELLSIAAATHTLCHRTGTKGSRNNTFSSDFATSWAISTPNIPSDPSFHQVLQIYLLSKSVPSPISVDYTSEQVSANTIIKTSGSSSNSIRPSLLFFYLFYSQKNILPCTNFKNSFRFQSILTAAF